MQDPISTTLLVIDALQKAGASYLIGGSLASTVHGIARATMDADLVSDITPEQVPNFARNLGSAFYADIPSIQNSIRIEQSFNIIHHDSMFKVDIFPLGKQPYDQTEFQRRQQEMVLRNPPTTAFVASPEDTILSKLVW